MAKVSVIMPAYNAEKFIKEAIDSIVDQSYKDWNLTIVNDGSQDNTPNIICEYVKKYPTKISMIDRRKNEGTVSGLNTLIENADGEYVCWLSADDIYTHDMIKNSVLYLDENVSYDLVYANYEVIDENTNLLRQAPYNSVVEEMKEGKQYQPYKAMITKGNCMHGCTVMARRSCYERVGVFNPKYKYAHDYDMWLRMSAHFRIGYIDCVHVRAREYSTQISMQGNNEVDALHVLFDFMSSNEWRNLYKKAGYSDEEETFEAVVSGMMKTYKNRPKEMRELYNIIYDLNNMLPQKYANSSVLRKMQSIMAYYFSGGWNQEESYFCDGSPSGYLEQLCKVFDVDAILLNNQAIRFDRYTGNTFERFHRGLERSNDVVTGEVLYEKLNEFLNKNRDQYRFYVSGEPKKIMRVGISYYMYRVMKIHELIGMKKLNNTGLDIWWELFMKLYYKNEKR